MIKIMKYGEVSPNEIFARVNPTANVEGAVASIIAEVAVKGDVALKAFSEKFDGVTLQKIEVDKTEIETAYKEADHEFIAVLEEAAKNIRAFHSKQVREGFRIEREDGTVVGQKITPIEKVGLYVPGGTAAYPSTVLMDSIPAKIAGCKEIVMVTPPSKDGSVNANILAAARVAGVDRIFKVGGAQAIAALAYGTESVPKVDKIVGPGNAYVAEAKRQVFGRVNIDMIAGPSEILVVADGTCNPVYVAADLLIQAEHDALARAVLVTDSMDLAKKVSAEVERQLALLPREAIARKAIENGSQIIVTDDLMAALLNDTTPVERTRTSVAMRSPTKSLSARLSTVSRPIASPVKKPVSQPK